MRPQLLGAVPAVWLHSAASGTPQPAGALLVSVAVPAQQGAGAAAAEERVLRALVYSRGDGRVLACRERVLASEALVQHPRWACHAWRGDAAWELLLPDLAQAMLWGYGIAAHGGSPPAERPGPADSQEPLHTPPLRACRG